MYRSALLQIVTVCALLVTVYSQNQMSGGFTNIPIDDEIQEMVNRAMVKINEMRNGIFYVTPVKILSAKRQIVAGIRTLIAIEVKETSCSPAHMSVADFLSKDCPVRSDGISEVITVSVWQKPWKNFEKITILKDGF